MQQNVRRLVEEGAAFIGYAATDTDCGVHQTFAICAHKSLSHDWVVLPPLESSIIGPVPFIIRGPLTTPTIVDRTNGEIIAGPEIITGHPMTVLTKDFWQKFKGPALALA